MADNHATFHNLDSIRVLCIVWLVMAVEFFTYGSIPHIDVYVVATNATLQTGLQPRAPPEIVDTRSQRVKILPREKHWRVCENKSGENLTLCSCCGVHGSMGPDRASKRTHAYLDDKSVLAIF